MEIVNFSIPIQHMLRSRGFVGKKLEDLVAWDLYLDDHFHDIPKLIFDVAKRIVEQIKKGAPIIIHGDYDADGVTATAVLSGMIKTCGGKVSTVLPTRDTGYGIDLTAIQQVPDSSNSLVITVDCGIKDVEIVASIKSSLGVDVIITDHHLSGSTLPDTPYIVNPQLWEDDAYKSLAGVGVAFLVGCAVIREIDTNLLDNCWWWLDLVAIGTIADVMPLLGINRLLVKHGLEVMSTGVSHNPGVVELLKEAKLKDCPITAEDVSFKIAPRINAAGRVSSPETALNLLCSTSTLEAEYHVKELEKLHTKRKGITEFILLKSKAHVVKGASAQVIFGEDWPSGILGIVAAKIAEETGVPTVVLNKKGDEAVGSLRGIEGIDLTDILKQVSTNTGSVNQYGGHKRAAGAAINLSKIEAFRKEFCRLIELGTKDIKQVSKFQVDAITTLDDYGDILFKELELFEPYGAGFPVPKFFIRNVKVEYVAPIGDSHSRGVISQNFFNKIPFVYFGKTPSMLPPPPWDVIVEPSINWFRGNPNKQLRIVHLVQSGQDLTIESKVRPDFQVTEDWLRANPNIFFVYGDNLLHKGKKGASIFRHFHNALGFVTKKYPNDNDTAFFSVDEYKPIYQSEIVRLKRVMDENPLSTFYISAIGSGLANKHKIWECIIAPNIENDLADHAEQIVWLF